MVKTNLTPPSAEDIEAVCRHLTDLEFKLDAIYKMATQATDGELSDPLMVHNINRTIAKDAIQTIEDCVEMLGRESIGIADEYRLLKKSRAEKVTHI